MVGQVRSIWNVGTERKTEKVGLQKPGIKSLKAPGRKGYGKPKQKGRTEKVGLERPGIKTSQR